MRLTVLSILLFTYSLSALTADRTDILFDRSAGPVERRDVGEDLARILGKEAPLSIHDSIAELCYGVDHCARKTSAEDLEALCSYRSQDDEGPSPGDVCYSKSFREKFTCAESSKTQDADAVSIMHRILQDTNQTYVAMMLPKLRDHFKKISGIDLTIDSDKYLEVVEKYPELAGLVDEVPALSQYTLDCYSKINPILYGGDLSKRRRHYNLISGIVSALSILPDYRGKVNRGVNLPESILREHHKVGNVVCYKGFTSSAIHHESDTGSKPRNMFLSGKCTQRMFINAQSTSKPGKLLDGASTSPGENEVLFSPGACFRIDRVWPRTDAPEEGEENRNCNEGEHYNFEMTLVD